MGHYTYVFLGALIAAFAGIVVAAVVVVDHLKHRDK